MANSDIVIRVDSLSKRYLIGHEAARSREETFREMLGRGARDIGRSALDLMRGRDIIPGSEIEEFWALKDVSFEVGRGEVVGIVGRNGSGKSTLLKILSRISEPTKGRVVIDGRVATLLEVGTGFHPELTGRENIFLNGAILGMGKREIKAKFDEIVAFAEIEKFIDTPVKRYSSGMYVRLAFAVAAHLEPEILVVDEVLAVGDAEFQRRCIGKMKQVAETEGRTVIFVSHNIPSVQQLCSSGLMLYAGVVQARGPIDDVITTYLNSIETASRAELQFRKDREGNGMLRVSKVMLLDETGRMSPIAVCGQPLRLRIYYQSKFRGDERNLEVEFNLRTSSGMLLTCFGNLQTGPEKLRIHEYGYFECSWAKVNLRSGVYISNIFIGVDGTTVDWVQHAFQLTIEDGDFHKTGNLFQRDQGDVVMEHSWSSVEDSSRLKHDNVSNVHSSF